MINNRLAAIDKAHLPKMDIVKFLNFILRTGVGMTKMDNAFKLEQKAKHIEIVNIKEFEDLIKTCNPCNYNLYDACFGVSEDQPQGPPSPLKRASSLLDPLARITKVTGTHIELIKLIYAKVIDKMSNRLAMNEDPVDLHPEKAE